MVESVSDELNVFDGQELCSTTFSTSPADGVYNGQINQHKQSDPIKIAGQRSDNKEELQIQRYAHYEIPLLFVYLKFINLFIIHREHLKSSSSQASAPDDFVMIEL
ncbi:hypothetical protein KUTeg_024062, partial [Tegillarca granosa]